MPLPDEILDREAELLNLLRESEARLQLQLNDAMASIIGPTRREARLADIQAGVRTEIDFIRNGTGEWLEGNVAEIYEAGSLATGVVESLAWNSVHVEAVQSIMDFHYDQILAETAHMTDEAKKWFRQAAKAGNLGSAIEGKTPLQVAREIRRLAPRVMGPNGIVLGLSPVVYRDGSAHSIREYSNMLTRTTTATTYNEGGLRTIAEAGIGYVEVFDGADCGATSHDDADKVNGTVRTTQWAREHLISHPNCRRSFGARSDVSTDEEARNATSFVSPESAADQARSERSSGAATAQRSQRRRTRAARQQRATRQPRRMPRGERPGDRFRGTGDWREGIADDFDTVAASRTGNWGDEMGRRGSLQLPGDNQTEALAAQRRIGNQINAEVARRDRPELKASLTRRLDDANDQRRTLDLRRRELSSDRGQLKLAQVRIDAGESIEGAFEGAFRLQEIFGNELPDLDNFQAVLARVSAEADDITNELVALNQRIDRWQDALVGSASDLTDLRLEVLGEIRDFGGTVNATITSRGATSTAARYLDNLDMEDIGRYFPTDWIDELNDAYRGADLADFADVAPRTQLNMRRQALVRYSDEGNPTGWIDDMNRFLPDNEQIGQWYDLPNGERKIRGLTDLSQPRQQQIIDGLDLDPWDTPTGQLLIEDAGGGIDVRWTRDRAYASSRDRVINVGSGANDSTTAHELMHHMDFTSDRGGQGWGYVTERYDLNTGGSSRTAMIDGDSLRFRDVIDATEADTYVSDARFPNDYSARLYDMDGAASNTSEVNSVGIQGYFFPEDGHYMQHDRALIGEDPTDTDYLDYMAGLLAVM